MSLADINMQHSFDCSEAYYSVKCLSYWILFSCVCFYHPVCPQVGTVGEDEEWRVLYEMDRPPVSDTLEIPNLIPFTQYRWAFHSFPERKTTFPST